MTPRVNTKHISKDVQVRMEDYQKNYVLRLEIQNIFSCLQGYTTSTFKEK